METVTDFIFLGSKITVDGDCSQEIKIRLLLGRKATTNVDRILNIRDIIFSDKGPYSQIYGFSSSRVQMWELDHQEGWVPKNWCFQIVLEKTLDSPLDSKEIKPVNPKGNQPWIFIGRTDAEAEAPVLWPPDAKSHLIGKDPDTRKDWRQEDRGWQRIRWLDGYHQLDGHEFEQAPGVDDGHESLMCCSPWGCKESNMTDWTELNWYTSGPDGFILINSTKHLVKK